MLIITALTLLMSLPAGAVAIYIDDQLQVGLHQDKAIDSAILKLLPSGTMLELIKRDTPMSQVREPGGNSGWIDNRYLKDTAPGRAQLVEAQNKIATLEKALADAKTTAPVTGTATPGSNDAKLAKENKELTDLLKSERLRVGELQAQIADLRNKLGKSVNETEEELQAQIEKLVHEKETLEKTLAQARSIQSSTLTPNQISLGEFNWRKMLIAIGISLLAGLFGGVWLMDWFIRRRHGGFRV